MELEKMKNDNEKEQRNLEGNLKIMKKIIKLKWII